MKPKAAPKRFRTKELATHKLKTQTPFSHPSFSLFHRFFIFLLHTFCNFFVELCSFASILPRTSPLPVWYPRYPWRFYSFIYLRFSTFLFCTHSPRRALSSVQFLWELSFTTFLTFFVIIPTLGMGISIGSLNSDGLWCSKYPIRSVLCN